MLTHLSVASCIGDESVIDIPLDVRAGVCREVNNQLQRRAVLLNEREVKTINCIV